MFGLDLNRAIVKVCLRILEHLPGIQARKRSELVVDLQTICGRCQDSYAAVLKRLVPIKNAFGDERRLIKELRSFAADTETRAAFKPEHLCGEIDSLLTKLKSYLDGLKFSVDFTELGTLRRVLKQMGSFDAELYHQYDQFTTELDSVANKLRRTRGKTARKWMSYVEDLVCDFESELRRELRGMRAAKKKIVERM